MPRPMIGSAALLTLAIALGPSCRSENTSPAGRASDQRRSPLIDAGPADGGSDQRERRGRSPLIGLRPLSAPHWLVDIPLDGFGDAHVSLPLGTTEPRPIMVGLHGHSVRPEEACEGWRRVTDGHPFIVCPHGLPADGGKETVLTLGSAEYTEREFRAGIAAVKARYGPYVSNAPIVFAGFSQGARIAVAILRRNPSEFPRAVLGEGGYHDLTRPVARDLAKGGLRRVLLLCSTKPCEITFRGVKSRLEEAGIDAKIASSGGRVHRFRGEVVEVARAKWPWFKGEIQ